MIYRFTKRVLWCSK